MISILLGNREDIKDITVHQKETRVKAIIINSKNEILLGYSFNTYQFLGGHLEPGETHYNGLVRELMEEAGLDISKSPIKSIAYAYYKNKKNNSKSKIYYYEILTDDIPNLKKTNYTDDEKVGNFELRYVPIKDFVKTIKNNVTQNNGNKTIAQEMLIFFKNYQRIKSNKNRQNIEIVLSDLCQNEYKQSILKNNKLLFLNKDNYLDIENQINKDDKIRIWLARKNYKEYNLFKKICRLLSRKPVKIYRVFIDNYNDKYKSIEDINAIDIEESIFLEKKILKSKILSFFKNK